MTKPEVPPAPKQATLAEQKSDFTSEGSPPPGKVLTATPVRPRIHRRSPARAAAVPKRRGAAAKP
jgi:hypothetical protein